MTKKINNEWRPFLRFSLQKLEWVINHSPSKDELEHVTFELSQRVTKKSKALYYELIKDKSISKLSHKQTKDKLISKPSHKETKDKSISKPSHKQAQDIFKAWESGDYKMKISQDLNIRYIKINKIINNGIQYGFINQTKREMNMLARRDAINQEKINQKKIKATLLTQKEEKILKLRISGLTLEEIGTQFDVSRERIRQILVKIRGKGFDSPKSTIQIKKTALTLKNKILTKDYLLTNKVNFAKEYKRNLSDQETAKNLDISLKFFKGILEILIKDGYLDRRLKIYNEKKYKEIKEEWDEIAAMRKARYSNQKIASILGTSDQMISIKIQRMKSNGYSINPYNHMKNRDYAADVDEETIAYRTKTIKALNNLGHSKSQISERLGMTYRDIFRHIELYMINY